METGLNRRESFSFSAMPSPNIPDLAKARKDLPLLDNRIGTFEPLLYGTIYIEQNMKPKNQSNNNNKNKLGSVKTK